MRCYFLPPIGSGASSALSPNTSKQKKKTTPYNTKDQRSQHNKAADEIDDTAYYDKSYYNTEFVDESLTQAAHTGISIYNKGVGCMVASPLTRYFLTASIACANNAVGIGGPSTLRVVIEHIQESGKYGHH